MTWPLESGASAWLVGAAASAGLAALAYWVRAVDLSGAVAGLVLATLVWGGLGASGFLLLAAFVAAGTGATRLGYEPKAAAGLAQAHGGRRGARHATANCGVAAACAGLAALLPHAAALRLAFAGALAAALADTLGSEVGQLSRRSPVLVTTWRRVPAGTDGAISWSGTLAGAAGAAAMGGLAALLGLVEGARPALAIAAAGIAGNLADSLLGATLQRRGLLGNDAVNFLNTVVGALVAAGL